jgi:hypothetical protein
MDLMVLPESALNARRLSRKHGHAAAPGAGPSGETCGSCAHLFRNQQAKVYLKCGLMNAYWTGGYATDVRAGDAACRRWERNAEYPVLAGCGTRNCTGDSHAGGTILRPVRVSRCLDTPARPLAHDDAPPRDSQAPWDGTGWPGPWDWWP